MIWRLEEIRTEVAETVSVMVAADTFLNPKHKSVVSASLPKAMQFLGAKLGMTVKDLQTIAPKLASQIAEVMSTSGSESSRKKKAEGSHPEEDGPEGKTGKKKLRKSGDCGRKRGRQQEDQEAEAADE